MRSTLFIPLALALPTPIAAQATWHVDVAGTPPGTGTTGDPYTSIQYAIDQPSTVGGDTLIVRAGTYLENIDFIGKDIIVRSQSGPDVTTIDGGQNGSVVTFQNAETSVALLEGFTVTNGSGTVVDPYGLVGGGILCVSASPRIEHCRIYRNRGCESQFSSDCVASGGGAFLWASQAAFEDCTFEQNAALTYGGGVSVVDSEARFAWCIWSQNACGEYCMPRDGGGAYFDGGSSLVEDGLFLNNLAEMRGGGLSGPACVLRSTFQGNYGYDGAGAFGAELIDCVLTDNFAGAVTTGEIGYGGGAYGSVLTSCVLSMNFAEQGGGVYDSMVTDSLLIENLAQTDVGLACGGGACASMLNRCQVVRNTARGLIERGYGGGLASSTAINTLVFANIGDAGGGAAWSTLEECTVVENVSTVEPGGGALASDLTSCVLWANAPDEMVGLSTAQYSNIQGGWPGTGNINADPLFVDAHNGNFHLRPGSPCIDAGDPASPPDLDGSRADMGAFQFVDCNDNGIVDAVDIASGTSTDLNSNAFPDECECLAYNYCETSPHSAGVGATMASAGTTSVSQNDLVLVANDCPPNKNGIFFYGPSQFQTSFGDGFRCVFGPVKRLTIVSTGPQGTAAFAVDYANPPQPSGQITPGSRWNFQFWFRDPTGPGGSGFNLTDGLELVFCP